MKYISVDDETWYQLADEFNTIPYEILKALQFKTMDGGRAHDEESIRLRAVEMGGVVCEED